MKILFLCHRFPFPPKRGGKIRPFNIIKHLAEKHEVFVVSIASSKQEAATGSGLADYCKSYFLEIINKTAAYANVLLRVPTRIPFSMGYFYSKKLFKRIKKELADVKFDLIFVHCSSVAQYVQDVSGIPKILDFGDMDSQKWTIYGKYKKFPLSLIYKSEGKRLRAAEEELAGKFDYCTCTTLQELKTLQSYGVSYDTGWFPNGVDNEFFKPSDIPFEPDTMSFIGRMDYYPNQECMFDFCRNTLPLIKTKRPDVKLIIVGANPPVSVRKLCRIQGVTVTGSVPDVRPYVQKSAVNIAPLNIARGTQNKILESMAMGVPVVTTKTAADGVDAAHGKHFLVASSHEEFADAVVRLLSDNEERKKYSINGRARMLSHHNWRKSMEQLDIIIEDCLENYGGHP